MNELELPQPSAGPEERNAAILRRTLSAVSWLYALWSGLFGVAALGQTAGGLYDPRLILLHAGLLAAAAVLLWKPRRGAVAVTFLAAAGSVFFTVLDVLRQGPQAAMIDGIYAVVAAVLLYKSRRQA
jgi:UPF0716 family protein affecting phage T7 exclusion